VKKHEGFNHFDTCPILENKGNSCHKFLLKAKGELIMTSIKTLLKGGGKWGDICWRKA